MKVRSIFKVFIATLLISLSSCQNGVDNSNSNDLSSIEDSNTNASIIEQESASEATTYVKDEDGFYILEDNFFNNDVIDTDLSLKENKVRIVDAPEGALLYSQVKMYIGDKNVDLYNVKTNLANAWTPDASSRMNNALGIIQLEGKATIKLQTNFLINNVCKIRPLSANITPTIDEKRRVISFEVSQQGQYTIELRSGRTIHLFVDEINDYESLKNNKDVIYFPKGIYNKSNCSYINNENIMNVGSNKTVVLDYGAVFQGSITSYNSTNVSVIGGGIIDGSCFDRNATTGTRQIPIDFDYCNYIKFEGITFLDPAGWCLNLYFDKNITIDNIKIISSRSNGDGISLQSCQDANVSNCFLRTWDDSLVVKNYPHWSNMSSLGTTKNIYFFNCIIWTDLAQSMEIGFETYGEIMDNIVFENITVLHNLHKPSISIHNANNANITNVKYKNITIEDSSGAESNAVIEFSTAYSSTWSNGHGTTALGSITGVELDNILVIDGNNNLEISIKGAIDSREGYNMSEHWIKDVSINNVMIKGQIIDSSYQYLLTNNYTSDITVSNDESHITGATFQKKQENLSEYGNRLTIL